MYPFFMISIFFSFFSIAYFSHRKSALIKKDMYQMLFGTSNNLTPFQTPIFGSLAAILDLAGGPAFQAVREGPNCC